MFPNTMFIKVITVLYTKGYKNPCICNVRSLRKTSCLTQRWI